MKPYDDFAAIKEAVEYQFRYIRPITPETEIQDVIGQLQNMSRMDIAQAITTSTGVWMEDAIYGEDIVTFADLARVHAEGGDGTGEYPY